MNGVISKLHSESLAFIGERESSARTYARVFDRVMARGKLSKIWDIEGNEYIDFLSCAGALALGHNHPYIATKLEEFLQSGHILQALDIPTSAKRDFIEKLFGCLPENFSKTAKIQFCGPSGADAVEAAVKLFKIATGRRSVLAFHGAYHGMTLGTMGLTGNLNAKSQICGLPSETYFLPFPHSERCPFGLGGIEGEKASLSYIEHILSDPESGIAKPALVIVEPIQGEGGCIPASSYWLQGLRRITKKYDVPLVVDEIQTGFARTGKMFAIEESGIQPDAIIMSKAIGGGFPLSVVLYHKDFDKWGAGAHAGTFRGNQIAFFAGGCTIDYLSQNNVASKVVETGKYLVNGLKALSTKYPVIGEIRGRGLMIGVEIVSKDECRDYPSGLRALNGELAKRIKRECFLRGLILETGGRNGAILRFLPPLVVTKSEIDSALSILDEAILDSVSMVLK